MTDKTTLAYIFHPDRQETTMKNEYSPAPSHTPGPYEIEARENSDWIFIQTADGYGEVAKVEAGH